MRSVSRVAATVVFMSILVAVADWIGLIDLPLMAIGSRAESFQWWTRYYETRLGLYDVVQMQFGSTPNGSCSQTVLEKHLVDDDFELVLVTYYDFRQAFCRLPWDLALHEACHRSLGHHLLDAADIEVAEFDPETEARRCEGWYR